MLVTPNSRGARSVSQSQPVKRRVLSKVGVAVTAIHACLFLPRCADDRDFLPAPDTHAGEGGSDAGASAGGALNGGGTSGRGGRGGSSGGGRGGTAGIGGSAGSSTAGETSGGENAGGSDVGGASTEGGRDSGAGGNAGVFGSGGSGASAAGGTGAAGEDGGASSGGVPAGAGGEAGAGLPLRPDFILGADISSLQEEIDLGATFVDTDAQTKSIFELLAAHGFNYIRLRTFVEPANLYGYANPNGDPQYVRAEPYCDRDHTAEFGKQAIDAGMKLLVDLHYSDNWADPGKQMIPEDWRDATTIEELGAEVRTYTQDLVQNLVDQGARPDIVQLGNEIHPGMLIHVPGEMPIADPWGNMDDKEVNPVNGLASDWPSLGLLLREGVAGVKAVDPSIRIMLHVANIQSPNAVTAWIRAARAEGVEFDILGVSCYTAWHGSPYYWELNLNTLASRFTDLEFVIAEYGPEARRANEIIRDLPGKRGLGTFVWEPTQSGVWGASMFSRTGDQYTALSEAFAVYDGIREDFGMP